MKSTRELTATIEGGIRLWHWLLRSSTMVSAMWCATAPAMAQWRTLNYPLESSSIACLYENVSANELLVAGPQSINPGTVTIQQVIMRYKDQVWDTLARMDASARSIIVYRDTVIAAGDFNLINDSLVDHIAFYDAGIWKPYGSFNGQVRRLVEIDGTLYAAGGFSSCDGFTATGVAKRTATGWVNVGIIPTLEQPMVFDLIEYDGKLVATGTIRCTGYKDLVQFDGDQWGPVGASGLVGGISGGYALAVYDGDLIVGGTIDIAAGNAGHAIMGWNGSAFFALGIGPQYVQGSYQYLYRVNDLVVHQGKLVAGGGFNYADEVPASRIAAWNGVGWCGLGGQIGGEVRALGLFNDTLIAATWSDQTFSGQDMNNMAAYTGNGYADTCATSVGISTLTDEGGVGVSPNPASTSIRITGGSFQHGSVEVRSMDGRLVKVIPLQSGQQDYDISGLSSQSYLLTVIHNGERKQVLKLVVLDQ